MSKAGPVFTACLAAVLLAQTLVRASAADSVAAPLFQYAIFYNGVLEFSTCSSMTINGPVRCNTNIYVGAGSGNTLTFNSTVTAAGAIYAPTNNGAGWGNPTDFNSGWRTTFNGNSPYVTNAPVVNLLYWATNSHAIIDLPPVGEDPTSLMGRQRLFNQSQVLLLVDNVTATTNITVKTIIQQSVNGNVPGADPSPYVNVFTNPSPSFLSSNLPFLSLTNRFYDGRERKTNLTTQIDVGKYATWLSTNAQISGGAGKFPAGSGSYPVILFVSDNRTTTAGQLTVVRLTNGIVPPQNGGQGFSVATPNPLYIWGNYNCTNPAYLGTTNTSASVPCAFFSDALTILSSNWKDTNSYKTFSTSSTAWDASAATTINAALLSGIVPSTGTDNLHFSGGVHNFTRLLEDWGNSTLWLNTSIVNLYNSTRATNQFLNPSAYYYPPTRRFSFDLKFSDPNGSPPPGTPMILYTNLLTILTQPQSQSVTAGQNAAFSVIADGVPTLRYQWMLGNVSIPGATNSSLLLSNVSAADAGTYSVFITNSFGSLTSSNATLTVNIPPAILSQPASQAAVAESDVAFQVTASGTGPLSYQWYFNGTNAILDATNATLTLKGVTLDQVGGYSVTVSNNFGAVTSSYATLAVNYPPAILSQPASQAALAGSSVAFQATATGTDPFSFQWYFNGTTAIPDATNATLTLYGVTLDQAGQYSVTVVNDFGVVTSSNATLVVNYPPALLSQPASQAAVAGSCVALQATATGTDPLSYQWYYNGTNAIAGATNATLTLNGVSPDQTGDYSVTAANSFGTVTSSNATVSVYASAASSLSGFTYSFGNGARFSVTGVPGLNYTVQASTNLIHWECLCTNVAPFNFVDTNADSYPRRFYRAIYAP